MFNLRNKLIGECFGLDFHHSIFDQKVIGGYPLDRAIEKIGKKLGFRHIKIVRKLGHITITKMKEKKYEINWKLEGDVTISAINRDEAKEIFYKEIDYNLEFRLSNIKLPSEISNCKIKSIKVIPWEA